MRYRTLGNSGAIVSTYGLGTMTFGAEADETTSHSIIDDYVAAGGNFIDTADVYSSGVSEEIIGRWLANHPTESEQVVIATKGRFPMGAGPNDLGTSRRHLGRALDASLRRLGVEHIDLYYQHRVDRSVPIEDTVGAMAELVADGKVRYLGLSEASPETVRRAHAVHPISALQTEYSLWTRDPEERLLPTVRELGIGFVAYSPLGRGFLSGRYKRPEDLAENDFRRNHPRFQGENFKRNLDLVARVEELAAKRGVSAGQLALAWVLHQGPDVVPIPGTKRRAYLEENIGAADVRLSEQDLAGIDEAAPVGAGAGDRYADMSTIDT